MIKTTLKLRSHDERWRDTAPAHLKNQSNRAIVKIGIFNSQENFTDGRKAGDNGRSRASKNPVGRRGFVNYFQPVFIQPLPQNQLPFRCHGQSRPWPYRFPVLSLRKEYGCGGGQFHNPSDRGWRGPAGPM